MAQLPNKQSVEERAVYLKDPARLEEEASLAELNQKRLEQEQISCFKDSQNRSTQRKRNNNDYELSVVLATKCLT